MNCIETNRLSYRYGKHETVLQDLNMAVPQGAIYGFLGPNGAGKTTTLRLLLGLLRKQEGSITLFGQSLDTDRISILRKTGAMIETPSLYAQLTAKENLQVLQKIYQCPVNRIAEVLNIVGLAHTGAKKAGQFSLGMKQRLGIAIALLHNPALLVLDEPTNGLDPAGILEIRALLKQLNKEQGMTILISSHLLTEIERVATHAGIIHNGQLKFQGRLDELQQRQAQSAATGYLTSNPEETRKLMMAKGFVPVVMPDGQVIVPVTARETIAMLNAQLQEQNIAIYQVSTIRNDLESIFINLTQN